MNVKKRVLYYDVLNILATVSVVAMHMNGMVHGYSDTLAWKQALVVEVGCFWAVPVFLMLSGATLVGYRDRYSTKDFFLKRFLRTAIPFVLWSLITAVSYRYDFSEMGIRGTINNIIECNFEKVYWFFPVLFSVYLAIPVISLLKDNRKILWYMVGCAFALFSFLPLAFSWFGLSWNYSLQMPVVAGYLMFPIIGYLLSTQEFKKTHRVILYAVGFACAVFRYVAVLTMSQSEGVLNRKYFDNLGFYCVVFAAAVFVFVKNSSIVEKIGENEKFVKFIKTLSGCSFGVYLVHMHIINHLLWRFIERDGLLWRTAGIFLTYFIAVIIVFIIKKVPVLKKIIP